MLARSIRLALYLLIGLALLTPPPNDVQAQNAPVRLVLGGDGATPWNIVNIKPGDIGIKRVTLHNAGTEHGSVHIWLTEIVNSDGDNPEPKVSTAAKSSGLSSHVMLKLSANELHTNLALPVTVDGFPRSAAEPGYVTIPLRAGDTINLNWQWELPAATGNEVQGDGVSFTMNYALEPFSLPSAGPGTPAPAPILIPPVAPIIIAPPKTEVAVDREGRIVQPYAILLLEGKLTLGLDRGTRMVGRDSEVPARVEVKLSQQQPPAPVNIVLVSPVYEVTAYTAKDVPLPLQFDPPLRLVLSYDPEKVPQNTESIFVAYHDEQKGWTQLEPPPGFVAGVGQAAAQVSHFTLFAVLAKVAAVLPPPVTPIPVPPAPPLALPARFIVRNLDISPALVNPGERVTISARLANTGELSGEHSVIVKVEGYPETSRVVTLAPGQSQEISISIIPSNPGTYQIAVDDASGSFTVEPIAAPLPLPFGPDRYQLIMITILAVVALTVLMLLGTRRPYPKPVRRA